MFVMRRLDGCESEHDSLPSIMTKGREDLKKTTSKKIVFRLGPQEKVNCLVSQTSPTVVDTPRRRRSLLGRAIPGISVSLWVILK